MRSIATTVLLLLVSAHAFAQGAPSWLEESLYGNGKINAVIAVVGIILLGVGIWLFAMDRRLNRMERNLEARSNKVDLRS